MFAVPPNTVALPADLAIAHPARIALEFAARRGRRAHLLRYDPDQRWAGLLERTDGYEVWLLSWLPGQRTELHEHGPATGAFTLITGALTERVVRGVEVIHQLVAGQTRVFAPGYVHQVRNAGTDPAVSIHVYRPSRHHRPVPGPLPALEADDTCSCRARRER